MFDFRQLKALATVIEEQSFDKAAHKLHITQSAVSQRIRQLEETVGQTLLVRSQPILPTHAGKVLLQHYRQIDMLQNDVLTQLDTPLQSGHTTLAIGVNADTLAIWFLAALDPILAQYPVLLDLKVDDQDQTHQLLRNGDVMACITSSPKALQGCHCIPLGVSVYRCLAAPAFIERYFPNGPDSAQLRRAPIAEFNHKDALQSRYLSRFFGVHRGEYISHRVPSSEAYLDLIIRGHATGMIPDQQAEPWISTGELQDIAPNCALPVPLYWHIWSLKSELARTLTQAVTREAERALDPMSVLDKENT